MKLQRITHRSWEIKWNASIGVSLSQLILAFWKLSNQWVKLQNHQGVEFIPGLQSLAIELSSDELTIVQSWYDFLSQQDCPSQMGVFVKDSRIWNVEVSYQGEDLKMLSLELGLSIDDIIQIHTAPIYFVSMIGFKPNFPYLWGLDTRLNIARRSSPRSSVPKGSVAIAAGQCGIYPESSPGGWHLLGNTSVELIQGIEPGDQIKFKRVSNDY